MEDISLHLLDIIENCAAAKAKTVMINIVINQKENSLLLNIEDDGTGMDEETLSNAQTPFYTSKTERKKKIGLGIPLFKQNAEQCNGFFKMKSELNKGTILNAQFQLDHIDRMPLGNVADTILTTIIGHPDIDYSLAYSFITTDDNYHFTFNTADIRRELGDIPLDYPDVIAFIRDQLEEGINSVYIENY